MLDCISAVQANTLLHDPGQSRIQHQRLALIGKAQHLRWYEYLTMEAAMRIEILCRVPSASEVSDSRILSTCESNVCCRLISLLDIWWCSCHVGSRNLQPIKRLAPASKQNMAIRLDHDQECQ